jgi:hypothetical protein
MFYEYEEEGINYKKKLVKNCIIINSFIYLIVTIICAIFYTYFGINAPFWINIIINLIGIICIWILWDENKAFPYENIVTEIKEAFNELKKPVLLLLYGFIDGILITLINIFLFAWTPILKESTSGYMNIGFIFILMDVTKNIGISIYDIVINKYNFDYYISLFGCIFIQGLFFYLINIHNSFLWRMLYFCIIFGCIGFFNSLKWSIISNNFEEKHKQILFNLFNLPFNFVFIAFIYVDTFTIATIAGILATLAIFINLCLIGYTQFQKEKNNNNNDNDKNGYKLILAEDK